jgi:hypothetical protein
MFAVPNHMLAQFSSELLTLYPTANILVAGKDDFEASRRARLFSRIATGNWDAVMVTHSSFEKIRVSAETRRGFISEQIREIEKAIREQRADRGTRLVKELERVRKRLEAKLETLSADDKRDNTLTFEELGIDRLFIDEAHKFKNLFYVTKMTRVAGLPQTASERAFDLFLKLQHIQARNKGGGVVFATGTSISNTMAEMFTMQRYMQMIALRRNQLQHFDSWAGTFGETVREGKVHVLLGSTPKMGEGTNVQKRLVALHHLDAPWRPADIEQREGRILRQGNENKYVKIFRYVTEGSFDAYMWQTLETKCRFIAQVMNGDATVRRAEDVDAAALTYAEVKAIASGNPLVIEKATIDAEVMRLTRLKKQHAESQYQMRYRIKSLGESAQIAERHIAGIREDLRTRTITRGDDFTMTVLKETFTDRTKAGRALAFLAAAMKPFQASKQIGTIAGFPITL